MAKVENESHCDTSRASKPLGESAIVRQMVELVDQMSRDDGESISATCDVAACLQLLTEAWPPLASSTAAAAHSNTPSWSDQSADLSEIRFADNRFEIRRMLGHGGFGVVLLAFDKRLAREVALKVPRPEILVSRNMRERFLREAQAAAALDHPNIVPVYDTGDLGPVWFITSRYVAGPTLSEWLRQPDSVLSSKQAAELVAILAEAVHHAHSRGVLHRDLKPANVLLEPNQAASDRCLPFSPRLSDFGLARRLDEDQQFTRHESLVGTPRYMAPEQAACRHNDVGIQTDVYGLGVILYELLTGHTPHVGDTDLDTLRRILDEPAPSAPLQRCRAPRDLRTICLKCLQKKSSQRYETAGALAADLRRFVSGEPIAARPVGHVERLASLCRRRPLQAALCAALFAVTTAGIAGVFWQWLRAEQSLSVAQAEASRAEENLQQLEFAFVDLVWVFEETELWTRNDVEFSILLQAKLRRYADEMSPQYIEKHDIPAPIAAALFAMIAKNASNQGQSEKADQNYRKSIDLWRVIVHENPERAEVLRAFIITLFGYESHLVKTGKLSGDTEDFRLVQQMFQTLRLPADDEIRVLEKYAHLMGYLGSARVREKRNDQAVKAFRLASQIWNELTQRSPKPFFRAMEARTLNLLSMHEHRRVRDFPEALAKTQQARQLLEEALRSEPGNVDWQIFLADTLHDEATLIKRTRDPSRAIPTLKKSTALYREALKDQPPDSRCRIAYGDACLELAQLLLEKEEPVAALPYYETCAENWNSLLMAKALPNTNAGHLAVVYAQIGDVHSRLNHTASAIAASRQSIQIATELRKLPNAPRSATTALIQSELQLGDLLRREGQLHEAVRLVRQAVALLGERANLRPNNASYKKQMQVAKSQLAALELECGHGQAAMP